MQPYCFYPLFLTTKLKNKHCFCAQKSLISLKTGAQIVKNLSVSTNMSTQQVWQIKMLIKQHDNWAGVPSAVHNSKMSIFVWKKKLLINLDFTWLGLWIFLSGVTTFASRVTTNIFHMQLIRLFNVVCETK